jgi:OOP family OmpA-OmpF porin
MMTMPVFLFPRRGAALCVAGALALSGAALAQSAPVPAPASLAAAPQPTPNAVVLAGTVPDEATHQAILQRVRELYGSDHVVDEIAIGPVVAPPNWSGYVQKLVSPDLKQVSHGQLAINGNIVELKGEVGNEALRQQVVSNLSTQLNPTYTVRNGLRVASNQQATVDAALANRIVQFESGSAMLTPAGRAVLDDMVAALKALPAGQKVQVIGHTDDVGPRDANIALSAARADSVKAYLVGRDIPAAMLEPSGAGPDRPVMSNDTPEGRARNRRIEFRVSQ